MATPWSSMPLRPARSERAPESPCVIPPHAGIDPRQEGDLRDTHAVRGEKEGKQPPGQAVIRVVDHPGLTGRKFSLWRFTAVQNARAVRGVSVLVACHPLLTLLRLSGVTGGISSRSGAITQQRAHHQQASRTPQTVGSGADLRRGTAVPKEQ